jgi:toxin-antitoxin system PIN domain toxin
MSGGGLLDVNVFVALFDPAHVNHEDAHRWFGAHRKRGWATCPVTINGCVRVLSNPAYPSFSATAAEVMSRLRSLCSAKDHEYWAEGVSLLDAELFRPTAIAGHQKITDVYLLGLAVRRGGTLITFDRSIPLKAVIGAERTHLRLLGAAAESSVHL